MPTFVNSSCLAVTVACAIVLSACSSGGHVDSPKEVAKSSPYAVNLELNVRDETQSNAFYRVDREGSASWGGAMQALLNETVWTGPMTDDERKQLHDLLIEHHWFDRDPISTNQPKDRVYRASV